MSRHDQGVLQMLLNSASGADKLTQPHDKPPIQGLTADMLMKAQLGSAEEVILAKQAGVETVNGVLLPNTP